MRFPRPIRPLLARSLRSARSQGQIGEADQDSEHQRAEPDRGRELERPRQGLPRGRDFTRRQGHIGQGV